MQTETVKRTKRATTSPRVKAATPKDLRSEAERRASVLRSFIVDRKPFYDVFEMAQILSVEVEAVLRAIEQTSLDVHYDKSKRADRSKGVVISRKEALYFVLKLGANPADLAAAFAGELSDGTRFAQRIEDSELDFPVALRVVPHVLYLPLTTIGRITKRQQFIAGMNDDGLQHAESDVVDSLLYEALYSTHELEPHWRATDEGRVMESICPGFVEAIQFQGVSSSQGVGLETVKALVGDLRRAQSAGGAA